MLDRLITLATLIRPRLNDEDGINRAVLAVFPLEIMAYSPFFVAALVSLTTQTKLSVYSDNALILGLLFVFLLLFNRFRFLLVTEFKEGMYSVQDNGLEVLALWSGALVFGPSVLWLDLISTVVITIISLPGPVVTRNERWQLGAEMLRGLTSSLLGALSGLWLYERLGGGYPIMGPSFEALLPAIAASAIMLVVGLLAASLVVPLYVSIVRRYTGVTRSHIGQMFGQGILVQGLGVAVAIPTALVYSTVGVGFYFIFLLTILSASYIAHRLSNALERNRQRTREMEQLERLARAIIEGQPTSDGLRGALQEFIPGMFSFGAVEVRLFPDNVLLNHPPTAATLPEEDWNRLTGRRNELLLHEGDTFPWSDEPLPFALLYIPIMSEERERPIGGVSIRRTLLTEQIEESLAAARSLTAQIASALRRQESYQQTIEYERSTRELELAGRIQQRFLSPRLQEGEDIGVPGCQVAMYLEPARNMSGDFFDALTLENGQWAFIVADVADKGVAASLYMALSITLLRTYTRQYSTQHPMRPDLVVSEVNERLLEYARTDQFVTLAFVYLDPATGACTYANCGHNPPIILRADGSRETLTRTGIPLGMMEEWEFGYNSFTLNPGETLVMYTDGVTEAQNTSRNLYDEDERFARLLAQHHSQPAETLMRAIVDDVKDFMGEAPSADDLTLMVLRRTDA